jgi:hypothetical protein
VASSDSSDASVVPDAASSVAPDASVVPDAASPVVPDVASDPDDSKEESGTNCSSSLSDILYSSILNNNRA